MGISTAPLITGPDTRNSVTRSYLHSGTVTKADVKVTVCVTIAYFVALSFSIFQGAGILFGAFLLAQLFRIWQVLAFCHAVWPREFSGDGKAGPPTAPVDIFVTTTGEDLSILENTVRSALAQDYIACRVYILNDAYVRGNPLHRDIENLSRRMGVSCITRIRPGGGKAGNINHALLETSAPFIAILDSDHAPEPHFVRSLMRHFNDDSVAIAQSPQYYANHCRSLVAGIAWSQQQIFYRAVLSGKNRINAAFMCGTNMILRRTALEGVGGLDETNIAEDFATSILIHANGWKSVYDPEILAKGLAPEDMRSYQKQQLRWAYGSLLALYRHRAWNRPGLSFNQKVQYMASGSYYVSGLVVLLEALLPLTFFFSGATLLQSSGPLVPVCFLLFMAASSGLVAKSSRGGLTAASLSFSISCFPIYVQALCSLITRRRKEFAVTSKRAQTGIFLHLAGPHFFYCLLAGAGLDLAIAREGVTSSVAINAFWAVINILMFTPFIAATFSPRNRASTQPDM